MSTSSKILDVIRHSVEMRRKSAEAKERAHETISQSNLFIDRSRKLLSEWPVSGVPALGQEMDHGPVAADREALEPSPSRGRAAKEKPSPGRIVGQRFSGETVRLDGQHFVDCIIENCTLEYGGGPLILEGTEFKGCRFRFSGEAAMTVSMLECFGLIETQDTDFAKSRTKLMGYLN